MFDHIDHIALAVVNLDDSVAMFEAVFGMTVSHREVVSDFDVEIATFDVGDVALELLQAKSEASPIHKFVETRGPGLHHVAFEVANIEKALTQLRAQGVRLIDETPRRGRQNSLVAFIHPKATQSVLYELVQRDSAR